jgi:hypothetical protein
MPAADRVFRVTPKKNARYENGSARSDTAGECSVGCGWDEACRAYLVQVEVPTDDDRHVDVCFWFVPDENELPQTIGCFVWGADAFGPAYLDEGIRREAQRRALRALLEAEDSGFFFDLTAGSEDRIARFVDDRGDASDVILESLIANRRPPVRGGDAFYAEVAELYVKCDYDYRRVREALEQRGEYCSSSTIRQWVFKARDKGLLSQAPALGRVGGELTYRARALLDPPHGPIDPPEREIVEGSDGLRYARRRSDGTQGDVPPP